MLDISLPFYKDGLEQGTENELGKRNKVIYVWSQVKSCQIEKAPTRGMGNTHNTLQHHALGNASKRRAKAM